jgi:hypothetical protein
MSDIIDTFEGSAPIPLTKHFEFTKRCAKYLRSKSTEVLGHRVVINVLNNFDKITDEKSREMWTDIIEAAGFYPYLAKEQNNLYLKNTSAEIRKEFHWSDSLQVYFHDAQRFYRDFLLEDTRNLILSAPTSFGKSLLIQELVASKKFKNIVIIQPTLALLDETRRNLNKYKQDYKIIVRTTQDPSIKKGNLFLLTAERVMEYEKFPDIDFFVLDEFYKLSPKMDPARSDVLNNAFNLLANGHNSRFYMLGPNIDEIPVGFEKRYKARFYNENYSLVDTKEIDRTSIVFSPDDVGKTKKKEDLFELLFDLRNDQTIIYCSSPYNVRSLARKFCEYLKTKNISPKKKELPVVEWIRKNVNVAEDWPLIKCLNYSIGVHDGSLEKHMTASIMRYFNEKELSYLFCTTTIIEGVNTTAKNVVYFENTKGKRAIEFFDYSNIRGRSGRLMKHYVGRIFNYNKPPEREKININIPIFDQIKADAEVLINIPDSEIINRQSKEYLLIKSLPPLERELFRKNGVSIIGQKKILEKLLDELDYNYPLLTWDTPNFEQLDYVLHMAWDNLKRPENGYPMIKKILTPTTFEYAETKSVIPMILKSYRKHKEWRDSSEKKFARYKKYVEGKTDEDLLDEAITRAYTILRKWFHYTIPKWLNVMSSLQKYAFEHYGKDLLAKGIKSGNYSVFAARIENDFIRENLAILAEYGIPKSAIDKLQDKLPNDLTEDAVLEAIANKYLIENSNLITYEKEKIKEVIESKTY